MNFINIKKGLFVALVLMLTANVQAAQSADKLEAPSEAAPCTNGFDSVNVCQLRS